MNCCKNIRKFIVSVFVLFFALLTNNKAFAIEKEIIFPSQNGSKTELAKEVNEFGLGSVILENDFSNQKSYIRLGGVECVGKVARIAAESSTTVFRAVSQGELEDIAAYGLRNRAGAYETGKLFAPILEEAAQFGKNNFMFDRLPNTIMKVKVPNSVMQNAYMFGADGMNAISIPTEYLQFLNATPINYSPLIP